MVRLRVTNKPKNILENMKISSYKNIFLDRDGIINEIIMRDGVVSSPRSYKEFLYRDDFLEFSKKISKNFNFT